MLNISRLKSKNYKDMIKCNNNDTTTTTTNSKNSRIQPY